MGRERMALSPPSFVSPTTGLIDPTPPIPGRASIHSTIASAAFQTHSVQVRRIGVSSSPSSRSCVTPNNFPYPLPTCSAAGTRSKNRFPRCGRIAVTPVRTESPSTTVVCPTITPATSVMALCAPVRKMPGATPRSRARGRTGCCAVAPNERSAESVARNPAATPSDHERGRCADDCRVRS